MTDEPKYARGRIEVEDWDAFYDASVREPTASNGSGSHVDDADTDEPVASGARQPEPPKAPTPEEPAPSTGAAPKGDKSTNGIHPGDAGLGVETADSERFEFCVLGLAV